MKRKGFTLIELLVVVAIIAALMAILLPSLATAREQAKSVKCLANLKSIAALMVMYSSEDNNTVIPFCTNSYNDAAGSGTKTFFTNLLTDNRNQNISGHYLPDTGWAYTGGSAGAWGDIRTGVWLCPSAMKLGPGGGYGVNRQYMSKPGLDGSNNPQPRPKLTSLEAPQDYWFIGDATENNTTDKATMCVVYKSLYNYSDPQPSTRHSNGTRTNIGFADGHGETVNWAKKQSDTTWKSHLMYVDNYH